MKLTEKQIEALAKETRQFVIDNGIWVDTTIFFNGRAYSTSDRRGHYFYNDPDNLVELEDEDPRDYFEYVNPDHIMSMMFEGPLYGCLNYTGEYGHKYDDRIQDGLMKIFRKYHVYYELGNAWNLTLFPC